MAGFLAGSDLLEEVPRAREVLDLPVVGAVVEILMTRGIHIDVVVEATKMRTVGLGFQKAVGMIG